MLVCHTNTGRFQYCRVRENIPRLQKEQERGLNKPQPDTNADSWHNFSSTNNHSHTLNQAAENDPEGELDGMMKNQKLNSDSITETDKHLARQQCLRQEGQEEHSICVWSVWTSSAS
jgi:hypothetical protein